MSIVYINQYINIIYSRTVSNERVLTLVVIHWLIGTGNAGYFIFYYNIIKEKKIKYITRISEVICLLLKLNVQLETGWRDKKWDNSILNRRNRGGGGGQGYFEDLDLCAGWYFFFEDFKMKTLITLKFSDVKLMTWMSSSKRIYYICITDNTIRRKLHCLDS